MLIREKITPRGDGNLDRFITTPSQCIKIREKITPRGDGN